MGLLIIARNLWEPIFGTCRNVFIYVLQVFKRLSSLVEILNESSFWDSFSTMNEWMICTLLELQTPLKYYINHNYLTYTMIIVIYTLLVRDGGAHKNVVQIRLLISVLVSWLRLIITTIIFTPQLIRRSVLDAVGICRHRLGYTLFLL